MDYDEIVRLSSRHPAWTLLRSQNVALVLSFLSRVFVTANAGSLPASTLTDELDQELFALNQRPGERAFPRPAAAYLDDWASGDHGWLRKYYPPGIDEPHYDLSPAVEQAVRWVDSLQTREFIGTESRLNTIFELLRQMVLGAETDPAEHLAELHRRRSELNQAITRAERGDIDILDPIAQRDRYQQFSRTARELLSDFRELEENFRRLDRGLREQIAGWTGTKGELLDEVLGNRNTITDSDQGRSFQAFYDFLLSAPRQAELTELLSQLERIDALPTHDDRLTHIHFDWIDASERTQATVRLLSEQLRRFLDDQVWLENRRVFDLLHNIETKALQLRDQPDRSDAMELDESRVTVMLPTERPLHQPTVVVDLDTGPIEAGDDDFDASALVSQIYVDLETLTRRVRVALGAQSQIGLDQVIADTPLEHGLAELIGYLSLQQPGLDIVFDEDRRVRVIWDTDNETRQADLPAVTYSQAHIDSP